MIGEGFGTDVLFNKKCIDLPVGGYFKSLRDLSKWNIYRNKEFDGRYYIASFCTARFKQDFL